SNTLLVGEKHVRAGSFGQQEGDGSIYNGDPSNKNADRAAGPGHGLAKSPQDAFNIQFGSAHSGGVCQFVLCDGSVRGIAPSVSETTLGRLAVRNDGQPVPDY